MKLINQRTDSDCTVACLAIYSDKSYEEVMEAVKFFSIEVPMTSYDQVKILKHFGFKPVILKTWAWSAKGIISLPSLNLPGCSHVVCWTGGARNGDVLDPQKDRDGKKFYTNEIMLNGRTGWSDFIADVRDPDVRFFAEREKNELEEALNQ